MTLQSSRIYRFATASQWDQCLFLGADRSTAAARVGMRPTAPFTEQPARFASSGAWAPNVTAVGEFIWRDGAGKLLRAFAGDDAPAVVTAPHALAGATRIVATRDALWVAGTANSTLECFDLDSLTRRLVVDTAPAKVVDLAGDGRDALLVLLQRDDDFECVRVDGRGSITSIGALRGTPPLIALANLPRAGQILVLAEDRRTLYGFQSGQTTSNYFVSLGRVRPCFRCTALGSDTRSRFLVGGSDGDEFGKTSRVLIIDADGLEAGEIVIEAEPTGVAGNRENLLVTIGEGLRVYATAQVASNISPSTCTVITPPLYSPKVANMEQWLRAEVWASLPPGTTLEMRYAATDDQDILAQARHIASDPSVPAGERVHRLEELLADWSAPVRFKGSDTHAQLTETAAPLAAPLFDARAERLWLSITLSAAPGAPLPTLARLDVRYAGSSLLDQLPMIYKRSAATPNNFLRGLLGVLEATTQETDRRIGSLGALIHPRTAPANWLDFIAEWLGLPWDEALSDEQKRAIALSAPRLAAERGTRRGLEALLDCLFPGAPNRYAITDVDVDFGLATLGGDGCAGSRLPAVLSGLPASVALLSTKTILGQARLPCAGQTIDTTSRFLGHLRVDLTATAAEQRSWAPWVRALIEAMVPASMQLSIRWRSPALPGTELSQDGIVLVSAPAPHLGTDAIAGYARLPPSGPRELRSC
jgi:phage tail-like protein